MKYNLRQTQGHGITRYIAPASKAVPVPLFLLPIYKLEADSEVLLHRKLPGQQAGCRFFLKHAVSAGSMKKVIVRMILNNKIGTVLRKEGSSCCK